MAAHKSITKKRIMAKLKEASRTTANPGMCCGCGCDVDGVEPDARKYTCESCGADRVYGIEELGMMIMFK